MGPITLSSFMGFPVTFTCAELIASALRKKKFFYKLSTE